VKIEDLALELERVKTYVGMSTDEFMSPAQALKVMGYKKSPDWLKRKLKRAYDSTLARDGQLSSLKYGIHYQHIEGEWLVNPGKVKQALADPNFQIPDPQTDYAS